MKNRKDRLYCNKKPLVSIIMPVYNAGDFLVEAVESIRAQGFKNWELLAIDDKSTDNSLDILQSFAKLDKRIKIFSNRVNKGIGVSLNIILRQAQGDYIARMDADDIALPDRLEKQLKLLQDNPNIVACGGQAQMIDVSGRVFGLKIFPTNPSDLYHMIMRMVPIQHPILMARSKVYKKYRYNEKVTTAEDVDLLFYFLSCGLISNVNDIIYQYRKSDNSNGYHSAKKTFYITFATRIKAIFKYGYKPSVNGLLYSLLQFLVVTILPAKLLVALFEAMRFQSLDTGRLEDKAFKKITRVIPAISK